MTEKKKSAEKILNQIDELVKQDRFKHSIKAREALQAVKLYILDEFDVWDRNVKK